MVSATDWIVGASSIAVAFCTLALAVVTFLMVQTAKKEASATVDLARETRTDRELAYRPFLVIEGRHIEDVTRPGGVRGERAVLTVRNAGRGPAVDVWYIVRRGEKWWQSSIIRALEPSEKRAGWASSEQDGQPPGTLFQDMMDAELVYSDVLGPRFRAGVTDQSVHAPEIWRPGGDGEVPKWVLEAPL